MWSSQNNIVTSNTFCYNSDTGVSLSDFSNSNNTLEENIVFENLRYGIYIGESSNGNTLLRNNVAGNKRQDIIDRGMENKVG
jgi:parallel beta-helix repeat protein